MKVLANTLLLALAIVALPVPFAYGDDDLKATFEKLASKCDELKLDRQAAVTREWIFERDPQRHYLFIPGDRDLLRPSSAAPQVERFWYEKFREARDRRAESLFALGKAKLDDGDAATAYRLVHETLRENSDHEQARRILGYHGKAGAWVMRFQKPKARAGRTTHRVFGWSRNKYWVVESEHFVITTNESAAAGVELAEELEDLYTVWRQIFCGYWNVKGALKTRWNGGGVPLGPKRQFNVVLFRDREDYVTQLNRIEPQIAKTVGYYHAGRKTSYFYNEDATKQTRWHEASHQFFQESRRTTTDVGATSEFWIVEGAALYMESLAAHEGYYTVGGFDADRLQYARYRKISAHFYLPMSDLASLGREQIQKHPQVHQLYSQAAGITHLIMDTDKFGGPDALVRYLQSVYQTTRDRNDLATAIGNPLAAVDEQYATFLQVDDPQLRFLRPAATVRNLCLARCKVTDEGLRQLRECENLEWLDLGFTPATDASVKLLRNAKQLRQLNLEGTQVTDAGLDDVGQLTTLEEVDLSGTNVTDVGVAKLKSLKNLSVLWLTGTSVTDASLKHIEGLSKLTFLNVSETSVTEAGLQRLKQKLPQLNKDQ